MSLMTIWAQALPILLIGARLTIELTFLGVFFGCLIGLFISLGRLGKNPPVKAICVAYTEFFRGTPLLVQLFMVFFGLPQIIGHPVDAFTVAVVALSLNSGAYISEIFRAGIQSIEKGQMEAARSLGMTNAQAMKHVILPQAFKRVIPPLGNEFIALLKDSSLVMVIGLAELSRQAQLIIANNYASIQVWALTAIIYLIMTLLISKLLVSRMERRLKTDDHS